MTCRPWPIAPSDTSEPPDTGTVVDGFRPTPVVAEPLCRGWIGGCERDGVHPRRDVPHTTRGGKGVVAKLRGGVVAKLWEGRP